MSTLNPIALANSLHRAVKIAIDTGEAASIDDAEALFRSYRLVLEVGSHVTQSAALQSALLTAVNTGRRCFLGGVELLATAAVLDADLRVPCGRLKRLGEAAVTLGATPVTVPTADAPRLHIGDVPSRVMAGRFAVRVVTSGWLAGIVPASEIFHLPLRTDFALAGVLAGAIGVSEAFQHVRGDTPEAGRRDVGLSLWQPEPTVDWKIADPGPVVDHLPSRLWVIGLGHLGQAFLWTLGLLPYSDPGAVELVLQDFDALVEANDSTSPLTHMKLLGVKKTRAMAAWAEERGFKTAIVERAFTSDFRVSGSEPRVALCGVDNPEGRAALEDVGFDRVIEAGLGAGIREYLAFQMHSFPSTTTARARWGGSGTAHSRPVDMTSRPGYRGLASRGLDQCGLTMLAGRSVGASFVGTATSTLVVAELLRMAMGAHQYSVVDGTLASLGRRKAFLSTELPPFNPGTTKAAPGSASHLAGTSP